MTLLTPEGPQLAYVELATTALFQLSSELYIHDTQLWHGYCLFERWPIPLSQVSLQTIWQFLVMPMRGSILASRGHAS